MRKAFILLVLAGLLLAGTACAAGQTNPDRQAAAAAEQLSREVREQRESGGGSIQPNDSLYGLKVTCRQQPALNGTGSWTIGLTGRNASQVQWMFCYLGYKDWTSDYTHVHWIKKDRSAGDTNPFMSSYTTPKIVTAGSYEVFFYVTFTDGTVAWYQRDFTISGTNALQNKISSVAAACRADTQWQTALNLHDWLTHNMYYDHSLQYYGADSILRGYGVCDSYSKAYLMLCKAAGITVCRVTNSGHAWNAVRLDGEWYYVDCTWDDPGEEKKKNSGSEMHTYFCLNDTLLGLDHDAPWNWAGMSLQKCTSLNANYTIHTGEWKTWGPRYNYDASSGTIRVVSFSEEIAGAIGNNVVSVTFGNDAWWRPNGSGIRGFYPDDYRRICLVYALNRTSIPLSDSDKVRIRASWKKNDNTITVRLSGWDIQETGTLTLPKNLRTVPEEAFLNSGATTLEIPSGCESIGAAAFKNSKLRTVAVPASVTQIAEDAFAGCGKIIFITTSTAALEYAAEKGHFAVSP